MRTPPKLVRAAVLLLLTSVASPPVADGQDAAVPERQRMYLRYMELRSQVHLASVRPRWLPNGSSFWYTEKTGDVISAYKVDASTNLRTALPTVPPEPSTVGPIVREGEVASPDGKWIASVHDHNVWLRSASTNGSIQRTLDGAVDFAWSLANAKWSADSRLLALMKIDDRQLPKSPIVRWGAPTDSVEWIRYAKAGDPMPRVGLFVLDPESKRQVRIDTGADQEQNVHLLGWRIDRSEVLFLTADRTGRKLKLLAGNVATGRSRLVLTETAATFVVGSPLESFEARAFFTPLADDRFLWLSERDGWNHLYLYDLRGRLIRRITHGTYPVLRVIAVDERSGWVYFTAHDDSARPYDTHLNRVNLRGGGLRRLTEASGHHEIDFSPSKQFFLDTHSTVARPPTVEWRTAQGKLLRTLALSETSGLSELRWRPPEEFVVKAVDGATDLYGVLYKPYDFDPRKQYPIIDVIYAGPQFSEVPHQFLHPHGVDFHAEHAQALAQLGFIAFVVDGRGTPKRGKVFQDLTYRQLGRFEIPDHVAALKQLAETRPYIDLKRVGVFGHSFGGYFAIRALLLAPDIYHVGIASGSAPDLDLGGMEPYMDLPSENPDGYQYASNVRLAANLKGKLLLIHGTSDMSDLFSGATRMVAALISAGKPYDLLLLPGEDHHYSDAARPYVREAIRRYFEQHLRP